MTRTKNIIICRWFLRCFACGKLIVFDIWILQNSSHSLLIINDFHLSPAKRMEELLTRRIYSLGTFALIKNKLTQQKKSTSLSWLFELNQIIFAFLPKSGTLLLLCTRSTFIIWKFVSSPSNLFHSRLKAAYWGR